MFMSRVDIAMTPRNLLLMLLILMLGLPGCSSSVPKPTGGKLVSSSHDIYSTVIKQCGVKEYVPSLATTRQLLTGFDAVKIETMTPEVINGEDYLVTKASAILDLVPISIITITGRKDDCVIDSIYWSKNLSLNLAEEAKKLFPIKK
jgi:hypothetical protein